MENVAPSSGTSVAWTAAVITAAGGRYQLCWCASGFNCGDPIHYSFASWLEVIGPAKDQDRTARFFELC